jgi:hypothetical protein
MMDVGYHMNYRLNGKPMFDPATGSIVEGIGHYRVTDLVKGKREAVMTSDAVVPCPFDRGLIYAFAAKFSPKAKADHMSGPCRMKGGKACSYKVTW